MIARFVLDCSVRMSWCFADEATETRTELLRSLGAGHEALVPALWPLEVANSLLVAERRGRITPPDSTRYQALLSDLPIVPDVGTFEYTFGAVVGVARDSRLTAYDASYLELALRTGTPLATLDAALKDAATAAGVVVLAL